MSRRKWIVGAGAPLVVGVGVGVMWPGEEPPTPPTTPPWSEPLVVRDLDTIRTDTLRVLVLNDPLTWERRRDAEAGLEYELLERFARSVNCALAVVPMDHPDSMYMALQRGQGDVVAAQRTPRPDHAEWVAYTAPYRMVHPVVASRRDDPRHARHLRDRLLPGGITDTATVGLWSPFRTPGYRLNVSNGRLLRLVDHPAGTPEQLLVDVVVGAAPATLVTDAQALYEGRRFPVLEFSGPVGDPLPQSFVVRRNAPQLLAAMNEWLAQEEESGALAMFIKAYTRAMPRPGALAMRRSIPVDGDSISPFDDAFREHGAHMRWEWELLAAMAYRESRFDSTAVSSRGAAGIMQIMPTTGARLGLDHTSGAKDHVRAAVRYLNKLDTMWMRAIPDRDQRLRFVLASYNAGPGHIIDAQRLAEALCLDPKRWEGHVERAVLLLAKPRYFMRPGLRNGYCDGSQVFTYVREVTGFYQQLRERPMARRKPAPAEAEDLVELPAEQE
jgi:membrane-bound lytic murein transglycosylase F